MPEAGLLFLAMPILIAAGSALVTAMVMQARAEAFAAGYREKLAELRALLATQHHVTEERVRAAEEAARRRALDELLADIHVEGREVTQGSTLVCQERVCFRSIPLTAWSETGARALPGGPVYRLTSSSLATTSSRKPAYT